MPRSAASDLGLHCLLSLSITILSGITLYTFSHVLQESQKRDGVGYAAAPHAEKTGNQKHNGEGSNDPTTTLTESEILGTIIDRKNPSDLPSDARL